MKTFKKIKANLMIFFALITSNTRVPRSPEQFNIFMDRTDNHQLSYQPGTSDPVYLRLGWSAQDSADWSAKRQAWDLLHAKYMDPAQSTTVIKASVRTFISDFHTFAEPKYRTLIASPATLDVDGDVFHAVLHRHDPTHRTVRLDYSITASFTPTGAGKYDVRVKTSEKDGRSGKPKGATHVETRFLIVGVNAQSLGPELTSIPKAMFFPDETFQTKMSTRAKFVLNVKPENSGKFVIVYVRWYVDYKPELSAEYSVAYLMRIP